ncbi:hypothetical protein ACFP81_04935 [Deinococcus lacus]|uniref:DUF4352 domain-containing protein n=1 Tax=Deinococcus lacus TaxID=392561 RepID=A0ABW1YB98_9DEIO
MKFADGLRVALKVLGFGVLAVVACLAFAIYAADTFWGNSEVTAASQERGGLSVRLTHPRVVKGRGDRMTMTVVNHTSQPVTVMEPFHYFDGSPVFTDARGERQKTAGNQTYTMIGVGPIVVPAGGSESGDVELYTEGLPASTYTVIYDLSLRRVEGDAAGPQETYSEVPLQLTTQVQVVPWWRLF